jgi:MerR family regulatory protein
MTESLARRPEPLARRAEPLARRAGAWAEQTGAMNVRLSIGDFSRMTYLSIKSLRRYHDMGLLVPAHVDQGSGYRYYDASQVPAGQVIRRFRDLVDRRLRRATRRPSPGRFW